MNSSLNRVSQMIGRAPSKQYTSMLPVTQRCPGMRAFCQFFLLLLSATFFPPSELSFNYRAGPWEHKGDTGRRFHIIKPRPNSPTFAFCASFHKCTISLHIIWRNEIRHNLFLLFFFSGRFATFYDPFWLSSPHMHVNTMN